MANKTTRSLPDAVEEFDSDDEEKIPMRYQAAPTSDQPMRSVHQQRDDFVQEMMREFIAGRDVEFDYSVVDGDALLDDATLQEREAEDAYFDLHDVTEDATEDIACTDTGILDY
jgi:hypothetical protein